MAPGGALLSTNGTSGLTIVYSRPMPRTAPWHLPEGEYHHSNSECVYAALTPNGSRLPGDGGKRVCPLCERLNRAESELEGSQ